MDNENTSIKQPNYQVNTMKYDGLVDDIQKVSGRKHFKALNSLDFSKLRRVNEENQDKYHLKKPSYQT